MNNKIEKYSRQLDIIDVEKMDLPIHIIGCGGIGSWTTLMLAKIGCSNITIYDFDEVEYHNTASQFFEERQIGELKTEALRSNVYAQSNISVEIGNVKEEKDIPNGSVIIIAVDSMGMRWKLNNMFKGRGVTIIDGRMGGLQAEVYCSDGNGYEATLVDPSEVQHEPCTSKAISFNCALIASMITNYVRLYINGEAITERFKERMFLFNEVMTIMPKIK